MCSLTFDRQSVVVLVDDAESLVCDNCACHQGMAYNHTIEQYEDLFARMAGCWQRAIYLSSPEAEYWGVFGGSVYNRTRDRLAALARTYGITVIDSTSMFEELCPYRCIDKPRHFTWIREDDHGPLVK